VSGKQHCPNAHRESGKQLAFCKPEGSFKTPLDTFRSPIWNKRHVCVSSSSVYNEKARQKSPVFRILPGIFPGFLPGFFPGIFSDFLLPGRVQVLFCSMPARSIQAQLN